MPAFRPAGKSPHAEHEAGHTSYSGFDSAAPKLMHPSGFILKKKPLDTLLPASKCESKPL